MKICLLYVQVGNIKYFFKQDELDKVIVFVFTALLILETTIHMVYRVSSYFPIGAKYHSSIRVLISSIYLAYLEIIQLNRLFLVILKIKNRLLFVINIINLLEVQYSISINWLLILILIQRLQIHEIVKIQNSVF